MPRNCRGSNSTGQLSPVAVAAFVLVDSVAPIFFVPSYADFGDHNERLIVQLIIR